jgi:hypothetical protein
LDWRAVLYHGDAKQTVPLAAAVETAAAPRPAAVPVARKVRVTV